MESGIIEQPPTKKQNTNGNAKDRISELPDYVLHHILSFLETKFSVQTNILSKRWTHLWASVPVLDLTDKSFIRNDYGELNDSDTHNFENFVDTVLLLRDASDLRSFSLRLYVYFDEGHVHRWIRHATKLNSKMLQIKFPWRNCYQWHLPLSILPCQSLEELSMVLNNNVGLGPSKSMVRLRRLQIQAAHLKHCLMENLIFSCPVLEDLDLRNCEIDALCISSDTLKRLSIKSCRFSFSGNLISTPRLVCLTYTGNGGHTTLKNLSSLLNATVHTTCNDAIELIRGLAYVETLDFSYPGYFLWGKLPEDLSLFPTFDNLRNLTLDGQCTSDKIQLVALFLQHSFNLKTFTLTINNGNRNKSLLSLRRWNAIQKSENLSFSCPQLRLIEIQCYNFEGNLHELIKYLMLNATGIPKIVINQLAP